MGFWEAATVVANTGIFVVAVFFLRGPYRQFRRNLWLSVNAPMISIKRGPNDDDQARAAFLEMLGLARRHLEIFDDGNKMPASIYEDPEVVDRTKEKLDECPDLKIVCFFNDKEDVLFSRELRLHGSVEIHDGIDPGRNSDREQVHYKIVDFGRHGYLSKHSHGGTERWFERYDFSALSGKSFDRAVNLVFAGLTNGVRSTVKRNRRKLFGGFFEKRAAAA